MAYLLEKQKTGSTPYVLINEEKGYMKFEGDSFHENVAGFFKDVNNWLSNYLKTDFTRFTFDFQLVYFNSSTAKLLLNMLLELDEHASDKQIIVNWITTEENDIIIECGEDFQEEVSNLEFNLVII